MVDRPQSQAFASLFFTKSRRASLGCTSIDSQLTLCIIFSSVTDLFDRVKSCVCSIGLNVLLAVLPDQFLSPVQFNGIG